MCKITSKMNAYQWYFPATEALDREQQHPMPRASLQRKRTPSNRRSRTNKNTANGIASDTMDTCESVEETLAFPRIEWTIDDTEDDGEECTGSENDLVTSSHHSAPTMSSKKPRHCRLVRSMSLKSSMCYLTDQSSCCSRRTSLRLMARGESWGQFISDEEEDNNISLYKLSLSDPVQDQCSSDMGEVVNHVDRNLSPFLVY